MSCPVEVTKSCAVAFVRELVASTRRFAFDVTYSARVIETVSVLGGAALMVSEAERALPFKLPVIVAAVVAATCVVLIVKFAVRAHDATVTLAGTVADRKSVV